MKSKIVILTLLAMFLLDFQSGIGQEFHFLRVDTTNFPTAKGWFFAKTKAGMTYADMLPSEFVLTENSTPVTVTNVECTKDTVFPPVSIALVLDASSSMSGIASGKETKLDWVKFLAKSILDTLKMTPGTQLQYLHFSSVVYKNSPWFTDWTDKTPLYTWIEQNEIVYAGATDFGVAFLTGNGAIEELKKTPYNTPRILIFVTDGDPERPFPQTTIDNIINKARENKILIYAIGINTQPNIDLRTICQETGGRTFDAYSKDDIKLALRLCIGGDVQSKTTCKLTWQSNFSCTENTRDRQIFAKFTKIPDSTTTSFKAPAVPTISSSATQLVFGPGKTQQPLILTAQGADYTVSEITVAPNNKAYTIDLNGKTFPMKILKGQNHTIKINFVETPPTSQISTLSFKGLPCPIADVALVAPCGGVAIGKTYCGKVLKNSSKETTLSSAFRNTTPIQISGSAAISGADKAEFTLISGGTFTLGPNQSVDMKVRFTPTSEGVKNANIAITLPTECTGYSIPISGEGVLVGVEDENINPILSLSQNHPNPFSDYTEIDFYSLGSTPVTLSVYNTLGEKVTTLVENYIANGISRAVWNSGGVSDGVYMIKLQSGNNIAVRQMILAR